MLNIDLRPTFTRTATFVIPAGAGFEEQTCEATFEALTIEEINGFDMAQPEQVKAFLLRVIVDLADVVDEDGNAVTYTSAVRDALINQDWGRQGLVRCYLAGRQKAAEGN